MSEETGTEMHDKQGAKDEGAQLSAAEKAKLAWAALSTGDKVRTLVTLGLSVVGAATVLRRSGKLARAGYRRARR